MKSLLQILRTEHGKEHDLPKKKYSEPKIFTAGGDITKRWYVYYSYRHPVTGKMIRQPNIYMDVNRDYKTAEGRIKALQQIKRNLLKVLDSGEYSPFKEDAAPEYGTEAALKWALLHKKKVLTVTTAADYQAKLNLFLAFMRRNNLAVLPIADFKRKYVVVYLNEVLIKNTAKTRNNHRIVLSSLWSVLKENEMVTENIVKDIAVEKSKSVRHKSYSPTQTDEILNLIELRDPELFLFIRIVAYNFLRPVEVCRLQYKDLKLNETPPYLEVRAKNKLEKIKIIPSILIPDLSKLSGTGFIFKTNDKGIDTSEINRRNFYTKRFLRIKKELKLGNEYTMYSFRHTFITKLYRELRKTHNKLATEDYLMKITGHSTLKALQMYLRDLDADLSEDYSHLL